VFLQRQITSSQLLIYHVVNTSPSSFHAQSFDIIQTICRRKEPHPFQIEVEDTGTGISDESMRRLFEFGFTTKKDGHGFGLHSSAILAKEMGGDLAARSEGVGRGACFTLRLPFAGAEAELLRRSA